MAGSVNAGYRQPKFLFARILIFDEGCRLHYQRRLFAASYAGSGIVRPGRNFFATAPHNGSRPDHPLHSAYVAKNEAAGCFELFRLAATGKRSKTAILLHGRLLTS
jgi:hypothetical protein